MHLLRTRDRRRVRENYEQEEARTPGYVSYIRRLSPSGKTFQAMATASTHQDVVTRRDAVRPLRHDVISPRCCDTANEELSWHDHPPSCCDTGHSPNCCDANFCRVVVTW